MCCGRCCVMEPRLRAALRLDIFIEILLGTSVNKGMKKRKGRGVVAASVLPLLELSLNALPEPLA